MITAMHPSLKGRVLVQNNILYTSQELPDSPELMSFISLCRRRGLKDRKVLPAERFQKLIAHETDIKTESEIQAMAASIIKDAYEEGATDIHITDHGAYTSVSFRILTMMQPYKQLMGETGQALIRSMYQTMSDGSDTQFLPGQRQDGRIVSRDYLPNGVYAIRLHTEPLECTAGTTGQGTFLSMRLLYDSTDVSGSLTDRLNALGYTESQVEALEGLSERSGLILFSGPVNSGKSTTLRHTLESIGAACPEKSLMALEDPPEYPLSGVKQTKVITNDERERSQQYQSAISGLLRADQNTVMIGEIRYPEAAERAVQAAMTAMGVLTTIHANSAFGIIPRMVSLLDGANCPAPLDYLCDQTILAGLVHQRLIPTLCPNCKEPLLKLLERTEDDPFRRARLPRRILNALTRAVSKEQFELVHVRGEGCCTCKNLGFTNMTVAAEVVETDRRMLDFVRNGEKDKAEQYWREKYQGRSYVEHALDLILAGRADPLVTQQKLGDSLDSLVSMKGDCQCA